MGFGIGRTMAGTRSSHSMHPLSIILLGFAMSTDAFAAAIAKGAAMRNPRWPQALRAGLIFGTIEGLTPIVGWLIGLAASSYITAWDHWVAFTLLGLLGAHMVYVGLRKDEAQTRTAPDANGFWSLAATGLATSIDAMAIGVGLAFLDLNIAVVALAIGLTTFVMVTLGIMLGRALGALVGKRAEIVGGIILIAIGIVILREHLLGRA